MLGISLAYAELDERAASARALDALGAAGLEAGAGVLDGLTTKSLRQLSRSATQAPGHVQAAVEANAVLRQASAYVVAMGGDSAKRTEGMLEHLAVDSGAPPLHGMVPLDLHYMCLECNFTPPKTTHAALKASAGAPSPNPLDPTCDVNDCLDDVISRVEEGARQDTDAALRIHQGNQVHSAGDCLTALVKAKEDTALRVLERMSSGSGGSSTNTGARIAIEMTRKHNPNRVRVSPLAHAFKTGALLPRVALGVWKEPSGKSRAEEQSADNDRPSTQPQPQPPLPVVSIQAFPLDVFASAARVLMGPRVATRNKVREDAEKEAMAKRQAAKEAAALVKAEVSRKRKEARLRRKEKLAAEAAAAQAAAAAAAAATATAVAAATTNELESAADDEVPVEGQDSDSDSAGSLANRQNSAPRRSGRRSTQNDTRATLALSSQKPVINLADDSDGQASNKAGTRRSKRSSRDSGADQAADQAADTRSHDGSSLENESGIEDARNETTRTSRKQPPSGKEKSLLEALALKGAKKVKGKNAAASSNGKRAAPNAKLHVSKNVFDPDKPQRLADLDNYFWPGTLVGIYDDKQRGSGLQWSAFGIIQEQLENNEDGEETVKVKRSDCVHDFEVRDLHVIPENSEEYETIQKSLNLMWSMMGESVSAAKGREDARGSAKPSAQVMKLDKSPPLGVGTQFENTSPPDDFLKEFEIDDSIAEAAVDLLGGGSPTEIQPALSADIVVPELPQGLDFDLDYKAKFETSPDQQDSQRSQKEEGVGSAFDNGMKHGYPQPTKTGFQPLSQTNAAMTQGNGALLPRCDRNSAISRRPKTKLVKINGEFRSVLDESDVPPPPSAFSEQSSASPHEESPQSWRNSRPTSGRRPSRFNWFPRPQQSEPMKQGEEHDEQEVENEQQQQQQQPQPKQPHRLPQQPATQSLRQQHQRHQQSQLPQPIEQQHYPQGQARNLQQFSQHYQQQQQLPPQQYQHQQYQHQHSQQHSRHHQQQQQSPWSMQPPMQQQLQHQTQPHQSYHANSYPQQYQHQQPPTGHVRNQQQQHHHHLQHQQQMPPQPMIPSQQMQQRPIQMNYHQQQLHQEALQRAQQLDRRSSQGLSQIGPLGPSASGVAIAPNSSSSSSSVGSGYHSSSFDPEPDANANGRPRGGGGFERFQSGLTRDVVEAALTQEPKTRKRRRSGAHLPMAKSWGWDHDESLRGSDARQQFDGDVTIRLRDRSGGAPGSHENLFEEHEWDRERYKYSDPVRGRETDPVRYDKIQALVESWRWLIYVSKPEEAFFIKVSPLSP
jgi:hypothetical protein